MGGGFSDSYLSTADVDRAFDSRRELKQCQK